MDKIVYFDRPLQVLILDGLQSPSKMQEKVARSTRAAENGCGS
jgi:hypothetical protein